MISQRPPSCRLHCALISAVEGTFVVARKKTSQVTMLEVVVGPHFGFSRTP